MSDHQFIEAKLWEGVVPYPPEFVERYIARGYRQGQTISQLF